MPAVEASVQGSTGSLLQAEGRTCEDFQDEDHYSPSPDSSLSPFDGDLSTTSSLSMDSLTTEGKGGEKEEREAMGKGYLLDRHCPQQGLSQGIRIATFIHR